MIENSIIQKPTFTPATRVLITIVAGYVMFGISSVFSASLFTHSYELLWKQAEPLLLGIVIFGLFPFFNIARMRSPSWIYSFAAITLLLQLLPPVFGQTVNGASRWVFGFQASDILSVFLIFYASFLCYGENDGDTFRRDQCETFFGGIKYIVMPMALILLAVGVLQKNFSTAVLQCAIFCLMLFLGKISLNKKLMGILLAGALLCGGLLLYKEQYRLNRLENWLAHDLDITLSPMLDEGKNMPEGRKASAFRFWDSDLRNYINEDGQQAFYSKISVISGGITGRGPAGGRVNNNRRLAISESDYIFSVLCAEYGFVMIAFFLCFTAYVFHRGFFLRASDRDVVLGMPLDDNLEEDSYLHHLAESVILLLSVQSLFHIWVNLSLFPVTGIPLPLISNGGSSKVVTLAMLGILLNITCDREHEPISNDVAIKKIIKWILILAGVYIFAAFSWRFIFDFIVK